MKGNVFPLENNAALTNKINAALGTLPAPERIITNAPSTMGSEDFHHLVIGNNKTVYDYIKVGIVNPAAYAKAIQEGKKAPFFHHSGNYQVDLAAIPLGTEIGVTALLEMFKK
jgi:metal-dependent amidase/aminoacylase/carboxypeptidase family protein